MKSGEFARLCGTTKNTLIHYDQMGLLHPSERHGNGYRDYSMADYARFSVIRAMTQAGFSLAQVREMLDCPDPEHLDALAQENASALKRRVAELRRSERLLTEIGRQAAIARKSSFEPSVGHWPERYLLVVEDVTGLRIDDDWERVLAGDAGAMEALSSLGIEASLSPYGVTADLDGKGRPVYRELFYLMPRRPRRVPLGTIATLPAGSYGCVSYAGPWKGVGKAYDELAAFIGDKGLEARGPWYEISQMRLLDTDDDHYRCTVFAAIA